jgi:glycosyltransferase involved in cell wall biosynthesis
MLTAVFVTGALLPGGAESHSVSLMNGLARRGHACHLVYIKAHADDATSLLGQLRLGSAGTAGCLNARRYLDARAIADFSERIARLRPSVIVSVNPYALMYARLAARASGQAVPHVVIYHSMRHYHVKARLQMLYYRPFFWMTECAVFVCDAQMRYCRARGIVARRNEVIPNGVDAEHYRERPQQGQEVREQLGFSATDYVVGLAARLSPEKNPLALVEALALLRRRGIPARGLLIGDGILRAALEERIRVLGLERDVVIAGMQHDVRPWIAACDVMVLCSLMETFSMAALEAMALGRPVVHSDIGGARDMISPGVNGEIFPAGDIAGLAACLERQADPARRQACARAARERVRVDFSESGMVDRYESLLLSLGIPGAAPKGLWQANTG